MTTPTQEATSVEAAKAWVIAETARREMASGRARTIRGVISHQSAANHLRAISEHLATLQAENLALREAMNEACDLLMEKTHANPARSAGHNARLCLQSALTTPSSEGA